MGSEQERAELELLLVHLESCTEPGKEKQQELGEGRSGDPSPERSSIPAFLTSAIFA